MQENNYNPEEKIQELSKQVEELKKAAEDANVLTLPVAIVFAGFLIAGGVVYNSASYNRVTVSDNNIAAVQNPVLEDKPIAPTQNDKAILTVSPSEHIFGDANAPVKIIEYSDMECPFCKNFHETMYKIMSDYAKDGRVAWVYRHFPLQQLHPKAIKEAQATECAAEIGGNDAFWKYLDRIFTLTPSNNGLDLALLPSLAKEIGVDQNRFSDCINSNKYIDVITKSANDGVSVGVSGTPFSIVTTKKGNKYVISGAQTYEKVKEMVETALGEK